MVLVIGCLLCGLVTFLLLREYLRHHGRTGCAGIVILKKGEVVKAEVTSLSQLERRYFQGRSNQGVIIQLSRVNPIITSEDAFSQASRIASERSIEIEAVHALISEHLKHGRRLNVLFLNLDLDWLRPEIREREIRL